MSAGSVCVCGHVIVVSKRSSRVRVRAHAKYTSHGFLVLSEINASILYMYLIDDVICFNQSIELINSLNTHTHALTYNADAVIVSKPRCQTAAAN